MEEKTTKILKGLLYLTKTDPLISTISLPINKIKIIIAEKEAQQIRIIIPLAKKAVAYLPTDIMILKNHI